MLLIKRFKILGLTQELEYSCIQHIYIYIYKVFRSENTLFKIFKIFKIFRHVYIYIVRMRSVGCSLRYIVVYKYDVILSSTMTLWYYNSSFCIRRSKKYCTKNVEILGVREIKFSSESMWLEIF